MTDTSGEPPVREVRAGVVAGGIALGVVLTWLSFVLVVLNAPPIASGGPETGSIALALAALIGIVLLAHPRSRQAGTGFLMGLAIGMITGAGACGGLTAGAV